MYMSRHILHLIANIHAYVLAPLFPSIAQYFPYYQYVKEASGFNCIRNFSLVSIHDFKINAVSKRFPIHSVNDSGVDDRHRKRMLFETVRDRFE